MLLMNSDLTRTSTRLAGIAIAWLPLVGCFESGGVSETTQAVGTPSVNQVLLDSTTVPQFVNQLAIPRTYAPTVITGAGGAVVRNEYTVTVAQSTAQILPPGFPATTVMAYGGNVKIPGSTATEFVRSVPGSVFDNTRNITTIIHWRNAVTGRHFMPVDPTIQWANPAAIEPPPVPPDNDGDGIPDFQPFPAVDLGGQSPVPMVTHNHGLVVVPQNDGIADEWFTAGAQRGPNFVTMDYTEPNTQPATSLFYHDHVMGMTRLNVYSGLAGTAYIIRDPSTLLDGPNSPLPKGEFEIPLVIQAKAFFTDGELEFPRGGVDRANFKNAYWDPGDDSDINLVNGKVWPNLNVKRQQYRFRALSASNGRTFNIQLDNAGTVVPFTLIGSDGGFLPAPQVVTSSKLSTTERADILVDFSKFAPGTKIVMRDLDGDPPETLGVIMQFTVQNTAAVTPPAAPTLVARANLPLTAPRRVKTLMQHFDADGDQLRSVDGLDFTSPPTEYPLIGSTEEWDFVNLGGGEHFIHIHLLEFQVVSRQAIDVDAYTTRWNLLNGHLPVTRPIVVNPDNFLVGPQIAPTPYETGWKDTARANRGEVLRLVTRWAPQETASGGVTPGTNQYPVAAVEPNTNAWYLWHCHVLGHEDNDMMRKMPMVGLWVPNKAFTVGTVVAFQNIDFRARVAHTSSSAATPPQRFDLWERVNNNDGTWQPQIIYAVGDRVLFNGALFRARTVHQAQGGQTPTATPANWTSLPLGACAQLRTLCADNTDDNGTSCQDTGAADVDADCVDTLDFCLAVCDENVRSPCSGLCNNPTSFTVPDGTTFRSGALGTGAACFETTSEIVTGSCTGLTGRTLTINGKVEPCNNANWATPLTGQRNFGYCIQTTAGTAGGGATFQVH
jgi:FtsP/CotA-like multicopper oxidase with cupredoxin domain